VIALGRRSGMLSARLVCCMRRRAVAKVFPSFMFRPPEMPPGGPCGRSALSAVLGSQQRSAAVLRWLGSALVDWGHMKTTCLPDWANVIPWSQ
jgi:hypothetical protein